MTRSLKFGNRSVGLGHAPFLIAEMSGNHNQSLERALELVDAAANAGAHALKIQTYTPDTMTMDCDAEGFVIKDSKSLWQGEKLYDLYKKAMTPWEWHEPIFKRAKEKGMIAFSTPFDESSVDFLEKLNVPFYKIASFENIDLPLIRYVAKTKKPIIMSTGMTTEKEIREAVDAAHGAGCKELVLLKCTSTYPASPKDSNLRTIPKLRELFADCEIGLSDHTMGLAAPLASIALGATVIEKHFTLRRADGGVDSAFSLEPEEFKLLVEESEKAWLALGKEDLEPTEAEKKSLGFRRTIYITEDLKAGDVLNKKNCRRIRPGFGLHPRHYEEVLGKKVKVDIKRGTPLTLDLLD